VTYPPRRSLLELVMQKPSQEAEVEAKLSRYLGLKTPGIRPWLHGGMLKVMPFRVEWK
jgi:hypothetical protein